MPNHERAIERAALGRIASSLPRILHSLRCVAASNPLAAEHDHGRLLARLKTKAQLSQEEATAILAGIDARGSASAPRRARASKAAAERVWGGTIDFVGVSFLERGYLAARSVARVAYPDGGALGTGFMVSDRLFLTNNHVLPSEAEAAGLVIEFGYELDPLDRLREVSRFDLAPSVFFLTDDQDDLDYTLIAVGDRRSGPHDLAAFGACGLSDAGDKHALGEVANIVQHPQGRYKEVVLRENRLVARLETVLHYVADTEPGSSGSPVFNNEWRVVALHHWGGPWRQRVDDAGLPLPSEVNEGIRISAIVRELRARSSELGADRRELLRRVLEVGEGTGAAPPSHASNGTHPGGPRMDGDGRVTWSVPVEISVRLPGSNGTHHEPRALPAVAPASSTPPAAERAPDKNYTARQGYKAGFISGFTVPMPELSAAQKDLAAPNRDAEPGDDPFELKYNHFSVVMNGKRRLAFFTACNIDGRSAKDIDRRTGDIAHYEPGEGFAAAPEASERWYDDDRLADEHIASQELYAGQEVPGFKKGSKAWMDRMFQRGHLVRRLDPAWGANAQAFKAEADTFHFTNCAPQVGFFNTGSADPSTPKSGGGQLWRAIEDYVRDNAAAENLRVCVFTGPVFHSKDPLWRESVIQGFRVPLRFWKVVVWAEKGKLKSVAMLADQGRVLKVMPERIAAGEAYADTSAVDDFLLSVKRLESITGLDFGKAIRAADIAAGEARGGRGTRRGLRKVESFAEIFAKTRRRPRAAKTLTPRPTADAPRRSRPGRARSRGRPRAKVS